MIVAKLNTPDIWHGFIFHDGRVCNPVQSAAGDWIVSETEAEYIKPEFYELIEWNPPPLDLDVVIDQE